MVKDSQTNFLFIADTLPTKIPTFYSRLKKILRECDIAHSLLPNTKDIWAVDYMPIQIEDRSFVQFNYNPDYLQTKKLRKTISDVDLICSEIGVRVKKSNIVLDGGNVIRTKKKVIMCDKIFKENPKKKEKDLIQELESLFEVDKIIFLPTHSLDYTGHADGMVRFINDDTVLINDLSNEKREYQLNVHMALNNAGIDWIPIPYNPYNNIDYIQAIGVYINYLQMENFILLPSYGMKEDKLTFDLFEKLFPEETIRCIKSNEIAKEGGVLNCITWNIRHNENERFIYSDTDLPGIQINKRRNS
jgi:agmatine deiminase